MICAISISVLLLIAYTCTSLTVKALHTLVRRNYNVVYAKNSYDDDDNRSYQVDNVSTDDGKGSSAPISSSLSPSDRQPSFFYSKKSFNEIGLTDSMSGVLTSLNLERPSKIQALSYSRLLAGGHCIVADQTGSGKTLAYLMPVLQRIIELKRKKVLQEESSRAPYVLIITPTTELATQVSKVVKTLANILKFRTVCITSTSDMDSEQKKLRVGVDVLVATPGRLISLMNKDEVVLSQVQAAIFDEADVLFMDQSFPLQPIGAACPETTQFIFTTATLPSTVKDQIIAEFPDTSYISGPGLHRIAPSIEEVLIDCSGPMSQEKNADTAFDNKRLALIRSMQESNAERTIIFCNTISQCRSVENALTRVDRQERVRNIYSHHGAIDAVTRERNIIEFSRPLLKQPAVLICTDRASRGIDFDRAQVDHVILFDFPQEPSEYVRRVGRTGRAGRSGKATVLVHGRQVNIAKQVLGASIEGKRIDPVETQAILK